MSFRISEIVSDSEFHELVEVEFISFEHPRNAFRDLFYPILGTGPDARQQAIKEATSRIIHNHRSNPFSHWVKAIDPHSDRLVGAALWIFFESDPYTGKPLPECTWWPQGEGREFTTRCLMHVSKMRLLCCRGTKAVTDEDQSDLNLCFVHPDFRRQGAGSQLLAWGVSKADEQKMVAYVDASGDGKALYEQFGFVASKQVTVNFTKDNPGELWKRLEKISLPHSFWPMSRPKLAEG
ncbi:uncharacterized protein LY89DRAFT_584027 [Mollisia scopiformis]|uniref:N-acetyltransferase domain-containing protein n=1 Tax=Mollisia scopiformis TaxID=149040 RepID=A0A194XBZ3_MOLSC|nr:uncharacterized protein LY89DRAFT_584027 [Mollisia scopiformis]KUJ17684.1 hypothetical protein LY89DRAFT_584027 [Mollisia scopiformis]